VRLKKHCPAAYFADYLIEIENGLKRAGTSIGREPKKIDLSTQNDDRAQPNYGIANL
jgi:hypothetical protein